MPSRRKIAQIRAEMGDFASARQASLNSLILSIIACAISTALVLMSADP